jgi:hypothetical protein
VERGCDEFSLDIWFAARVPMQFFERGLLQKAFGFRSAVVSLKAGGR